MKIRPNVNNVTSVTPLAPMSAPRSPLTRNPSARRHRSRGGSSRAPQAQNRTSDLIIRAANTLIRPRGRARKITAAKLPGLGERLGLGRPAGCVLASLVVLRGVTKHVDTPPAYFVTALCTVLLVGCVVAGREHRRGVVASVG